MNKIILSVLLLISSPFLFADFYSYECEVLEERLLEDNGALTRDDKIYQGSKFNVDRKSGVVLGGGLGNSSYPTKTIIDPGGQHQAYKLLWLSKEVARTNGGRNAVYLSVSEYAEGPKKPFIVLAGSRVLTGICQ